jgi:cytochrome c-type biogenesis protein CcmH/NrfG
MIKTLGGKNVVGGVVLALLLGFFSVGAVAAPATEALLAEGRVDDAIVSLRSRINDTPDDAKSYNLLCRAYLAVEKWDEGVSACQRAVSLEPGSSRYHLWLGRIYGEKANHSSFVSAAGLAKKVRNEFETAVRLDPGNLEARADLAEFYVEAPGLVGGGKDKAEAQARELTKLDPREADLIRARVAEKNKDLLAAENYYRAAIEASGGKPGAWLSLAQFYRRTGELDKMQDAVQHAVSAQNNRHILMPAAEVLLHAKRGVPQAIKLLRHYLSGSTVEDAPAFKAHYLLGTLLEQQGDKGAAAEEYRASLSFAKDFTPARKALERLNRQIADNLGPR